MARLTTASAVIECSIVDCTEPRAPGSSWCAEHRELFRQVGRATDDAPPPRVPAYLPVGRPPMPARGALPAQPPIEQPIEENPIMTPVNQLCSIVTCEEPRAEGSNLCERHRERLDAVSRVQPATPPVATCCEDGCDEPVLVTPTGRTFQRCKHHHGERIHAGRKPKAPATNGNGHHVEPVPPVQADPDPVPESEVEAAPPVVALAQQAGDVAAELMPGALEQLIRQALASNPDAVSLNVTGFKVTFSGEIEITS